MQYECLDMHVPTVEVDSIGLYTAYGERQPILLQRQKSTANFLSEISDVLGRAQSPKPTQAQPI
jgi:hypothetical protein